MFFCKTSKSEKEQDKLLNLELEKIIAENKALCDKACRAADANHEIGEKVVRANEQLTILTRMYRERL